MLMFLPWMALFFGMLRFMGSASVCLLLCTLYTSSAFAPALYLQSGETVFRPTHTTSRKRQSTVLSLTASPITCGLTLASPTEHNQERIDWNVRPATIADANQTAKLLSESYYTILPQNYDQDTLSKALPSITTPRAQLLNCGTWYVVEDPVTKDIVGCGGWTLRSPAPNSTNATDVPVPNLRHFATHPGWTRRGIGKALWTRTLRDISDAVGPETPLEVYSTLTGEPFYASFGFVPVRREEVPLAKDCLFSVIFMRRESQQSPSLSVGVPEHDGSSLCRRSRDTEHFPNNWSNGYLNSLSTSTSSDAID
jgi:GNAT superfamily N-acetyltransferase